MVRSQYGISNRDLDKSPLHWVIVETRKRCKWTEFCRVILRDRSIMSWQIFRSRKPWMEDRPFRKSNCFVSLKMDEIWTCFERQLCIIKHGPCPWLLLTMERPRTKRIRCNIYCKLPFNRQAWDACLQTKNWSTSSAKGSKHLSHSAYGRGEIRKTLINRTQRRKTNGVPGKQSKTTPSQSPPKSNSKLRWLAAHGMPNGFQSFWEVCDALSGESKA